MKLKFKSTLLLGIFTVSIYNVIAITQLDKSIAVTPNAAVSRLKFSVINSVTEVNRGNAGFITIKGKPGTRYYIKSSYRTGNKNVSVTQWRVADASGEATFNWVVSKETEPGKYPVTISGAGDTLSLYHTVLP